MKNTPIHITTKLSTCRVVIFFFGIMEILNCRGFRLLLPISVQQYTFHSYKICTFISIGIILFYCNKDIKLYKSTLKYIFSVLILCFLPQYFYTSAQYSQTLADYIEAVDQYIFIVWAIPILYVFKKKNGIQQLLEIMTTIINVGYSIILVQALLKNYFNFVFFNVEKWGLANGRIRMPDLSSFAILLLIFNWYKFLCHTARKKNVFAIALIVAVTIYVDRGRVQILTMLLTLFLMLLFYNQKKVNKVFLWSITIISSAIALSSGLITTYLSQFTEANNGISTTNRLKELEFYLGKFTEHKFFGIGLVPEHNIYDLMGISSAGNMNPYDIGIFGSLGVLGLGVIIIYGIVLVRWGIICKKTMSNSKYDKEGILLLGIFAHALLSSFTMIVLNYVRIPVFPFYIAIFEYFNYLQKYNVGP